MKKNPDPAWIPDQNAFKKTHIADALNELNLSSYDAFYQWSIEDPKLFWSFVIKKLGIIFKKPFDAVLDLSKGVENPIWLVNARLNIVDSCFQANEKAVALIYLHENKLVRMTYGTLLALTNRVANGLVKLGAKPGDAVAIIMPMHYLSVAIYLAVIKTGCTVVSIADSFSADEIKTRLKISDTKMIFTQHRVFRNNKYFLLYQKIQDACGPRTIVLGEENHLREQDVSWENFLSENDQFESVSSDPSDPINILFSSGTTGTPKAIPWDHTTAIKAASDAYFHHDIHANDVLAWPTNLGWMMGPWLVFAGLINQASIALYEDAATTRAFGEFVQNADVTMLGLVPSLVKSWRHTGCMEGLNWQCIRSFSSSGECSNTDDMLYLMSLANNKPIIEYCGGTEIGGAYITSTLVQPNIPSTFSTPALGSRFILLNEEGKACDQGEVALIPPSMGSSTRLLNADHHAVYYEDMPLTSDGKILRRHGDELERLENNYFRALGRVDDTMNLGGIKISSVEIERVLAQCDDIVEVAAVAVNPTNGGPSELIIFAHVKTPTLRSEDLRRMLQTLLHEHLNPLFKIHDVVIVDSLPRTASNKIMRRVLRENYMKFSQ